MENPNALSQEKLKILVVEDSQTQVVQLQHMLESQNFEVITATNGEQALQYLQSSLPALVISGILMPGIDGYALCQKIKEDPRTSDIPVILLTSLSNPEDVLDGLACGADDFLTKSFNDQYLLSHVEQILTNKRLNRNEKIRLGIEVNFFGKPRFIKADQQQMLTLLFSTYEAAVLRNNELASIQEELKALNDNLEDLVEERTRELSSQQKRYLTLFNQAPVMFLSYDPVTLEIVECNDTLLQRTGFSREELIGGNIHEKLLAGLREEMATDLKEFAASGIRIEQELTITTKLGVQIPVLFNVIPLRNETGEILQSLAAFQDITAIKRAEEELKQSEERYRTVADSAVDAIITLDSSGLIVGWNKAAEKLFGYTEKEMAGEPVTLIMPEEYRPLHQEGFYRLQHTGDSRITGKTVELKGKRKNGEEFPVELSLASWTTDDGRFFTGIIRDITTRKNTEQELLKAKEKAEESDKLKSAFLANMSHEIRTPMNGIIGFVQLLEDPDITADERDSFIEIIKASSNRLLQVITDIVDISKIEAGQEEVTLSEVNIHNLAHEILAFYKPKANAKELTLELISNLDSQVRTIVSDPVKLRQAVSHLVDNALKFTSRGGVVLEIGIKNQILTCKVIDTGIGIAPELHERIFDRFRQEETDIARKFGGTGLGLALAKSYIEMLEGTIWLTSDHGKGSTFVIEVPVRFKPNIKKEQESRAKKEMTEDPELAGISILVAEDEPDNLNYIRMLLERFKISLVFAGTGEEAIDRCKSHPELSLVLMDVKMPVMDGLEATRMIRKFRPDLPIIATTAFAMESDKERCITAGCNDYISKPIRKDILLATIKKFVL